MKGCTNPNAVNYNGLATEDDGSCVYLDKFNGECHAFQDVEDPVVDEGFTVSFSIARQNWVYFHDYKPDYYVMNRKNLYAISGMKLYLFNASNPGIYFDSRKSWFIDVVFKPQLESILDALYWITEVLQNGKTEQEEKTITHLTVWSDTQSTGRIALDSYQGISRDLIKIKQFWTFSLLRDLVKNHGQAFMESIFKDFKPIESNMDRAKPFYLKEHLTNNYFIARFEFDNSYAAQLNFLGAQAITTESIK